MFLQTVSQASALRKEVREKCKRSVQAQILVILSEEGCVPKGAACPGWRLGTDGSPLPQTTRGPGPVTPRLRGELTPRPLTPPPGELSCSEPQSKTKGRREEGATVPSNHRRRPRPGPSPPAASRPLLRWPPTKARAAPVPCLRAAAGDSSRGSSRGAARDGKTRWLHPSSLLHPSLPVPAAWPPSAGARLARAHPRERVAFV